MDLQPPSRLSAAAAVCWHEYLAMRPEAFWTPARFLLLETAADAEAARRHVHAELEAFAAQYPDDSVEIERKSKTLDRLARRVRVTLQQIGLMGRGSDTKKAKLSQYLPPYCYLDSAGKRCSYVDDRAAGVQSDDALHYKAHEQFAQSPTEAELRAAIMQLAQQTAP